MRVKKDRIKYIDIAKCIAMILVIHNHWMLDYNNAIIKIYIAAFHMPLFFLLSGLTLKPGNNIKELLGHIFKRIKTIMLPFYLWQFCYIGFGIKRVIMVVYGSNLSISAVGGIGGSWFLPCFFIADILACIAFYFTKKNRKYLGVAIIIYFAMSFGMKFANLKYGFPFNLDVAFSGAGFICIGHYANEKNVFEWIEKCNLRIKSIFIVGLFIVTGLFALLNTPVYSNIYGRVVMALGYYGHYWMFILGGIAGALLIITLSICIQNTKCGNFLAKMGINTFSILMIQQIVIDMIENILNKSGVVRNLIYPIILSVVCIVICDFIANILTGIFPNLKGSGILPKQEIIKKS